MSAKDPLRDAFRSPAWPLALPSAVDRAHAPEADPGHSAGRRAACRALAGALLPLALATGLAGRAGSARAATVSEPDAGQPPAPGPIEITLTRVAPRCGLVQGLSEMGSSANGNFISNAGFIETADSVVAIDALGSPTLGRQFLARLRADCGKPVSHVIVTHYHADHIYGLQPFKEAGAQVIAHRKGLDYLGSETARLRLEQSRADLWPWVDETTRLVPADRWIDGRTEIGIGGVRLVLEPAGPAHTAEDLAIHLPTERVLFCGDLVFAGRLPWVGQADSRHWITALESLLALDVDVLVPGHGPASRDPRHHIALTRDYLVQLRSAMGEAARNLEPFDEAYRKADWSQFSQLPLFDAANRMNAYNTFLLMEQER